MTTQSIQEIVSKKTSSKEHITYLHVLQKDTIEKYKKITQSYLVLHSAGYSEVEIIEALSPPASTIRRAIAIIAPEFVQKQKQARDKKKVLLTEMAHSAYRNVQSYGTKITSRYMYDDYISVCKNLGIDSDLKEVSPAFFKSSLKLYEKLENVKVDCDAITRKLMLKDYLDNEMTMLKIAQKYGVAKSTVFLKLNSKKNTQKDLTKVQKKCKRNISKSYKNTTTGHQNLKSGEIGQKKACAFFNEAFYIDDNMKCEDYGETKEFDARIIILNSNTPSLKVQIRTTIKDKGEISLYKGNSKNKNRYKRDSCDIIIAVEIKKSFGLLIENSTKFFGCCVDINNRATIRTSKMTELTLANVTNWLLEQSIIKSNMHNYNNP